MTHAVTIKKPKKESTSSLEKALIASEIRYRRLFESAKDGILILDAQTGMIVDVNPFLIELLGYSKESFIKKTIWEIGFFKDIIDNKERFSELQQNEYVRYEDLPLETTDGRKIHVEFVSNVYLADNQKVIQCNIREITKRKASEAGLEKTREELAVLKKSADEVSEFAENLINTVREPLISDVNINEMARNIFDFFKPEAEKKELNFSYLNILSISKVITKTDKEKLYAVLTNLVKNALKFTKTGSIELGYEKKDKFFEFFVKDTGSGIPQEQKEFIFERFRQGSESTTRKYEGAGLGLAISKAYVHMLGGKIWLESRVGQGSIFRFTIPNLNGVEEKEQLIEPEEEKILHHTKLKILVAEDDETSRALLEYMVKPLAYAFFQANTGIEAVEICRRNPDIDLVLMDIQMPEMDGHEATRKIREFNKKVVIVAQTAHALKGDREKAINAGCTDYISKPISRKKLTEIIENLINK